MLFPYMSNRRRALQLGWYGLRKGPKLFERLNRTNLFLARQFTKVQITCNVCGKQSGIWYEMHSVSEKMEHRVGLLRETLECRQCLSRMRYRIMAAALLAECRTRFGVQAGSIAGLAPQIASVGILDTDSFSPASRILSRNESYIRSSYVPDKPFGSLLSPGHYNIDLQQISFADASLDVILSSDVMEHVRRPAQAFAEIFRCLKPGGAHLFTIPFDDSAPTRTLVDTSTDEDIYLEPPQLHGDDHLTGRIPAYRIYGRDLLDDLKQAGFEASLVRVNCAATGIFDGRYFVARRPA